MSDFGEKVAIVLSVICSAIGLADYCFSGNYIVPASLWEIVEYGLGELVVFLVIFITILLWIRYAVGMVRDGINNQKQPPEIKTVEKPE